MVGVADEDDPRLDGDVLSGEPVGVAASVEVLVGAADDSPDLLELLDRRQDALAEDGMLLDDRDCSEVLTQLVSARKGIKSLAEKLIHSHTHHCIEHAASPAEGRRKLRELLVVLERYVE